MNCNNCGHALPDDSIFCQYCGCKIEINTPESFNVSEESSDKEINQPRDLSDVRTHDRTTNASFSPSSTNNPRKKYCKRCGNEITGKKICDICHPKKEDKHKTVYAILSAFIAILLLGNIILGILLYKNYNNTSTITQELSAKNAVIEELEASLKKSDQTNQSMQERVDNYRLGFERYNTILEACKNGNIGYASSKFHTDVSIVAINRFTTRTKITLTANFNKDVTISMDKEGIAADIDFDEDTWSGSTTSLTIKPKYNGVTVASFSNSINNETFSVIIIVY